MIKKFTIDRSKWIRGAENARLLRTQDNKMCCLGFYSLSCGLNKLQILSKIMPHHIDTYSIPPQMMWLIDGQTYASELAEKLQTANDDMTISNEIRELKIKELFLTQDIEVEFIG